MLKLLIVKTSSLGDVVHNLPVVADIIAHHPNAQIDWLVEESFADIPRLHPQVNRVITIALRRWRKAFFIRQTWSEMAAAKKQIAAEQYDLIIDTQGLIKSGLVSMLANGVRHGYDKTSIREPLASNCYQVTHAVSRQLHAVVRNRALVASAFNYVAPTNLPNYGITAQKNTDVAFKQPYIIGLHGTSRDSKLWPSEHWVALGTALAALQLQLLLPWASAAEFTRATDIASKLNNATVLPKCSIAQLASIIASAKAAIGVDTGLSHLSVALNIPTIAIYTDTNPVHTGVFAGAHAPAINLGNVNMIPSVAEVMQALATIYPQQYDV